jgi:hypothetical protein
MFLFFLTVDLPSGRATMMFELHLSTSFLRTAKLFLSKLNPES